MSNTAETILAISRDLVREGGPAALSFDAIAARLGKHKRGKSCWYIKRLADVDEGALRDLIRAGLEDLETVWTVKPT